MNKQDKARIRNRAKWRLKGGSIPRDKSGLTLEESIIIDKIEALRRQLLNDWDRNSKAMGFKVTRYKVTSEHGNTFIVNAKEASDYRKFKEYTVKKIK